MYAQTHKHLVELEYLFELEENVSGTQNCNLQMY